MNFESFGLDTSILAGIRSLGYTTPTPVQAKTIPNTLSGHDVMGLAQTGTGKTAAFVLPMLHRLITSPNGKGRKAIRALIVAPTRELAEQIDEHIRDLGKKTPVKSMSIYGGASAYNQVQKLRRGVDIVVACPGRLLDLINKGNVDLSAVEMLVLDEADRMLDMGFLPDIKKILTHVPAKRQTLLFSATMPEDIRKLTTQIMHQPVIARVDHGMPAKTISHALYPVAEHLKTPFLIKLLRHIESESVLIFTRTKHRAKRVTDKLQKDGFRATPLQGNMTQGKRQESIRGFKSGKYRILVATDIAARGMDVSSISHVINYDMPDTADAYTHRVGRTGRAARTGEAFTLVTAADRPIIRSCERVMGMTLTSRKLEGFDYHAPAPSKQAPDVRYNTAPRKQATSTPRHNTSSRTQATSTPRHNAGSRKQATPTYGRNTTSRTQATPAYGRNTAPRTQATPTPRHNTASRTQATPTPRHNTSSRTQAAPAYGRNAAPRTQATPTPRHSTASRTQATSAPRHNTASRKQTTPAYGRNKSTRLKAYSWAS